MPTALVELDGAVWASGGGVQRWPADLITGQTEPLTLDIGSQHLAEGPDGKLWSAVGTSTDENPTAGAIHRVDPKGAVVELHRPIPMQSPGGLIADLDAGAAGVWIADGFGIMKLTSEGEVERRIEVRDAYELVVGQNEIWVAGGQAVRQIDLSSGAETWRVPVSNSRGGIPMVLNGGTLWVASDDEVLRLSEVGEISHRIPVAGANSLIQHGMSVWAASASKLYRLTNSEALPIASYPTSFGPVAIAAGRAWIADEGSGTIRLVRLP